VKKYQKDNIETQVSGSNSTIATDENNLTEESSQSLLDMLVEKLMATQVFEDELTEISKKPITMLMPQNNRKRFFLYSPVLNLFKDVGAPVEAIILEEYGETETLCMINNIVYVVPTKYLKDVGYN